MMSADPLAQFRKTPLVPASGPKTKEPEEYTAFAAKDKVLYLEIRRANDPARSPRYAWLLDVSFDDLGGTNFVIAYSFMLVLVRGSNLQEVIFAIQNGNAFFIQEFDPDRWAKPKNEKAPFIKSIEIHMQGGDGVAASGKPTTH
jgi:hypothetical protein